MAGIAPVADDGDGFSAFLPQVGLMKMAADKQVGTVVKAFAGLLANGLLGKCIFGAWLAPAFFLTEHTENIADFPGQIAGENADEKTGQSAAKKAAQPQITPGWRQGVAMVQGDGGVVQLHGAVIGEDRGLQRVGEKWTDMEIVVALNHDDAGAAGMELLQFVKQGKIVTKHTVAIAHPEFKNVAEQNQRAHLSTLLLKKVEQVAVCRVVGPDQMGIGDKQIFHGAYYSSRP